MAAIDIGRPLIDPELSNNRVTTVSRNSISLSTLKDRGVVGLDITRASLPQSNIPSSISNSQLLFCCACNLLCNLFANLLTAPFNGSNC